MKIQLNTTHKLEIGEKLDIRGTGIYIEAKGADEDPSFDAVRHSASDGAYVGVLPIADNTLEHLSTGKDLLAAEPRLKNAGEKLSGVVVSKEEPEDEVVYYNIYSVEVVTSAEAKKSAKETKVDKNTKVIILSVQGMMLAHEAKADVIRDFNDGEEVVVEVSYGRSGEPTVVYPKVPEDDAGTLLTAGEIIYKDGQLESLTKLLAQKSPLEAKVVSIGDLGYQVELAVDNEYYDAAMSGKKVESMDDVLNEIHKSVGTPMDVLNDIYAQYKSLGLSNKVTKTLLKKIRKYDEEVVEYIPSKPKTMFNNKGTVMQRLLAYVIGQESLLLAGDMSTGKDLSITTIAYLLQKPMRSHIITQYTDNHDLTGTVGLQSQEEGGGTYVRDSFLIQMMKHGGIVHLAEINVSNQAVMTVLNPIVEKGQKLIDIDSSGERVIAHEDFLFYGSMNPGYAGTSELNWATDSRMPTIDYGTNEDIYDLLKIHHESKDAPEEMLDTVNKVYRALYQTAQDRRISPKVLAFRRFASACYYASEGLMTLREVLSDNVLNKAKKEERDIIHDILDTYIR